MEGDGSGGSYGGGRGGRGIGRAERGGRGGGRGRRGGRSGGGRGSEGEGRRGDGGYRPQFQQPPPQHQQEPRPQLQQPRQRQEYQQQSRPAVGRTGPVWRPATSNAAVRGGAIGGPVSNSANSQPSQESRNVAAVPTTAAGGGAAVRAPVSYASFFRPSLDSRVASVVSTAAIGGVESRAAAVSSQTPPRATAASGPSVQKTPEGAGESSKSGDLVPMRRPDRGGSVGRQMINIVVNHFPVKFDPELMIRHYIIDVKREDGSDKSQAARFSKSTLSVIKDKLFAENPSFPLEMTAYDGEKNVFSAVPLPTGDYTVELSGKEDTKRRSFTVTVTKLKEFKLDILRGYFSGPSGEVLEEPRNVLQGLDVVMKEHQRRNLIRIGRTFHPADPKDDIGQGMAASWGMLYSLRPTSQGLALCLDYSVLAVRKKLPVITFLEEHVPGFNVGTFQSFRQNIECALKGLKVTVTHRRTNQKYIIAGLTDKNVCDISFTVVDPEDHSSPKVVSLLGYFEEKYPEETIKHKDIPCLNLGKNGRMNYVPMEFCVLVEGQRYPKDDLDRDAGNLLKSKSVVTPGERRSTIHDMLQDENGPCGGGIINQFHIEVQRNMTRVKGRLMEPPQVRLRASSSRNITRARMDNDSCQWNLTQNSVVEGISVERWAILDFSSKDKRTYSNQHDFIEALVGRCNKLGLRMDDPLLVKDASMWDLADANSLTQLLDSVYHKQCQGNLQFLLCVMSGKDPGYKHIKWISETKIGIVTQCCLSKMANKKHDQYLANLGMKINAKLGGINVDLAAPLPLLGDCKRVMLIGADVNHPRASDLSSPSIAALVASTNALVPTKYIERLSFQKRKGTTEEILGFGKLCMELIESYEKINGFKPQKLVIFRDGVSEGQFDMVLNEELVDLKKELEKRDYCPTITLIVARKRHHTRLFPETRRDATKDGNIPPGTVVDTTIVHPYEFDFYLCSHYGSMGTSKPTHYSVLWDENNFSSDNLQKLIYHLCFTYARCCKPVSLVPPVYYADLLAFRGRLYYDAIIESQSSSRNPSVSHAAASSSSSGSSIDERLYTVHPTIKNGTPMYFI